MLIVALVLAVIGLAALVTAVVTSNEFVAWVCIAASGLGVILLIVDAIRERQRRDEEVPEVAETAAETPVEEPAPTGVAYSAEEAAEPPAPEAGYADVEDYPDEAVVEEPVEDTPEVARDEPEPAGEDGEVARDEPEPAGEDGEVARDEPEPAGEDGEVARDEPEPAGEGGEPEAGEEREAR
jgi:hypothetical protein